MSAHFVAEFTAAPDSAPEVAAFLPEARLLGRNPVTLAFHDSFDWRLFRSGYEWAMTTANGSAAGLCTERESGRRWLVPVSQPPRFAADLPPGKWHDRLAEALEMRALEPKLEVHGDWEEFAIEGEDGAAPLHLSVERYSLPPAAFSPALLSIRWRLSGPKESRKAFRQLVERLDGEFGLHPASASILDAGLAVLGRFADDPSALSDTPLDPELRADAALKELLLHLLHTIEINQAGVLAETDTEFLHDFRVAVRRTRSALGQVKNVFPDRDTARFGKGFAELARMTSEPRDLDVYLLDLSSQEAVLPTELRGRLEPLQTLLHHRARIAHARLNRYLGSAAYRRLLGNWQRFLDLPPPRRPRAERALLPIREVAGARIWKLYRRVLDDGTAITPDSPAEQLHDLRKTAKKLRYLMELFRTLYPPDQIKPLVKLLKKLQENLGDYQDIHVQIGRLRELSEELRRTGAPVETLLALGALLDRLYLKERSVRDDFQGAFSEFAADGHPRRFRQLFKPATGNKD